jgi:hypothetical protein
MERNLATSDMQEFPDPETSPPDESPQGEEPADSDSTEDIDLSETRIRQISGLRRGAFRTRSWFIIGAIVCLVAAVELAQMAVAAFRLGHQLEAIGEAFFIVVAIFICGRFVRRSIELTREINTSRLEEPSTPPDLSALSDGSQRWENLNQLAGGNTSDESDEAQ